MILTVALNPSVDVWLRVPALRVGAFHRADAVVQSAGGKGINVARLVHALGERTIALATAGGPTGAIFEMLLQRGRLPHQLVALRGETHVNYKIITTTPPASTEINTPGSRLTRDDLQRFERRLASLLKHARCVIFSGSLPPGAPSGLYYRWIRQARRQGVMTVLDTSGEALRSGLAARPWLVKPNREEAETLLHVRLTTPTRIAQAVRRLVAYGPAMVALSLGAEGAVLGCRSSGELWWAHPPMVRVASMIGAGDALVGGLVTTLMRGWPPQDALRFGVTCAAMSSTAPDGGGGDSCTPSAVGRFFSRVRLKRLN